MHSLLHLSEPWWHFAMRGVVIYLWLLFMLRSTGKRSFGEMSALDVVELILVGNHATGLENEDAVITTRLEPNGRITLISGGRAMNPAAGMRYPTMARSWSTAELVRLRPAALAG